jgi:hypothetical protein
VEPASKTLAIAGWVHQRERAALRLEAGHDFTGIHAGLDEFERDQPAQWLLLLSQPDLPHAAFAQLADKLKALRKYLSWLHATDGADPCQG